MTAKKLYEEIGMIRDDIIEEANLQSADTSMSLGGYNRKKGLPWWKTSMVTAAAILILFVCIVNLFPKAAYAMSRIPGLEYLVKAVMFDQSLLTAVENDYFQYVSETQTKDGITFSVDYMIVDASRISIFCEVIKPENVNFKDLSIVNEDGTDVRASANYSDLYSSEDKLKEIRIDLADSVSVPKTIVINPIFTDSNGGTTAFSFKLMPEDKYAKVVNSINIGRSYELGGQSVTFDRLDIYPTQAKLILTTSKDNTAIFRTLDIYLEGSKGDKYYPVSNGVNGTISNTGEVTSLWFESTYFTEKMKLKLHITGYSSIDKDKLNGEIDMKNNTISNIPENVSIVSMAMDADTLKITLKSNVNDTKYATEIAWISSKEQVANLSSTIGVFGNEDNTFCNTIELPDYEDGKYQLTWAFAPTVTLEKELVDEINLQ